jgi:hypothetical protein
MIMKRIRLITYLAILLFYNLTITGCNDPITEFGFDGSISGTIFNDAGGIVPGDITSSGYTVHALGASDKVSMVMRIAGDGTFANHKLYPQTYKVWVEGPFFDSPEVNIDLTGGKKVVHDFEVTPFLTLATPALEDTQTSSQIIVSYGITGNNGSTANLREIYCSTVPYPNPSTGSGPMYHTVKVTVTENQGTATIDGLKPGTKYYIRVGARSSGSSIMNFSEQIVITTPAV